jgi:hypothetical protein
MTTPFPDLRYRRILVILPERRLKHSRTAEMKERFADVRPSLEAHCESAVLRKPRKRLDPWTSDTDLDATVTQSPAAMGNVAANRTKPQPGA